jgi:hypothetical protein
LARVATVHLQREVPSAAAPQQAIRQQIRRAPSERPRQLSALGRTYESLDGRNARIPELAAFGRSRPLLRGTRFIMAVFFDTTRAIGALIPNVE